MSAQTTMTYEAISENKATFRLLIEHWAKSRIDVPLQLIARYDEAGRQLVTIGTALETVFTVLLFKGGLKDTMAGIVVVLISSALGLAILLAALAVCRVKIDTRVMGAFELFGKFESSDQDLWNELRDWCRSVEKTVGDKRRYLLFAKSSLILGFIGLVVALLAATLK